MSKMLETAEAIGAHYGLIIHGDKGYTRFYKRGSWEVSRNCLLFWNDVYQRWDNSSELSLRNIIYGVTITGRTYDLIDFVKQERTSG